MGTKQPFRERLKHAPLLLDGAMGTMLYNKGVIIDSCFDECNLSQPDLVRGVHVGFLDAGADIIETNTFSANALKLAEHSLANQVKVINQRGVEIAQEAIASGDYGHVYIAGAVGPLGIRLAPYGRISVDKALRIFIEHVEPLAAAGIDLIVLETFSDLREIEIAVRAIRDVDSSLPILAQATYTRDDRTIMGDTPAQVANKLAELKVEIAGANCSNGPMQIIRLVRAMREAQPDLILSAVPNAGWPEHISGRVMYTATADYFGDFAATMRAENVAVIGGCCGTRPEHIAAMRKALDSPEIKQTLLPGRGSRVKRVIKEAGEAPAPSELARKLTRDEFIVAVEMSPPKSVAAEKELRAAQIVKEAGADVVDVLDSPMARMRMSPWALCQLIQKQVEIETVLHFPTRGRNLLRIQGDLLAAHAMNLRNIFVVMGDPTRIGDFPDAADTYDIVPSGLIKLVTNNLNKGIDSADNPIGHPTNFLVSAALSPNAPDIDKQIDLTYKKVQNGADYFLSQPIYDIYDYHHFMDRYAERYGPLTIPVIIGILPLNSLRNATFLHNEVPGIVIPDVIMKRMEAAGKHAHQEGAAIAQELAIQVRDVAQGIYLMPQFNRYDLAADIIEVVKVRETTP